MMSDYPKVITMYLPQFYETKENSQWWGNGFTEWSAVKAAQPLFENHMQPRIPLNSKYYCLLDKDVMRNQQRLMKKYHIYGQCFYHYWFKDGKRVLEKPAENLLNWRDIDMPFCFSWANESWVRSWSNLCDENSWAVKFENHKKFCEGESGILLEQDYGLEKEWIEHFYYLLPFFKDNRYIKLNGKPVFIFYQPIAIPCIGEMLECWRKLAAEEGLPGLYLVGTNIESKSYFDAILWQQPKASFKIALPESKNGVYCYQYDDIWRKINSGIAEEDNKIIYSGFIGYDDTPRRGNAGRVCINNTPGKFQYYFTELMGQSARKGNEFVFLNAWNEWGEGMYLEPDEKYGFGYLEAVKNAVESQYIAPLPDNKYKGEDTIALRKSNEKYMGYWKILNRWLILKERGVKLEKYLVERKVGTVAIYGLGMLGRHLVEELKHSSIVLKYGIDRRTDGICLDFPVYSLNDNLPEVDLIVVTATYDYENIRKALREKVNYPMLSLSELIFM